MLACSSPVTNSGHDAVAFQQIVHGVCQRPLAETVEEMLKGLEGEKVRVMGACWLVGGKRRHGKATSSAVVFFEKKLALGSHMKVGGRWLP